MHYSKMLKNSIYLIKGKIQSNEKLANQQPWGEIDWQSGIERWKLEYNALFNGYHNQLSDISILPEAINFIDRSTIFLDEGYFEFESLTIFQNNPYFNLNYFDALLFGRHGKFANGKLTNGEMKIVGDFSIIRVAEKSELITWIDDI